MRLFLPAMVLLLSMASLLASAAVPAESAPLATGDDAGRSRWLVDLGLSINRWVDAIPLGNGLTGAMLWGNGRELRVSLDRGDLWDLRNPKEISEPGFTFANMVELVKAGKHGEVARLFDHIYSRPSPTKLPGARVVIKLADASAQKFVLDMARGSGFVKLDGGRQIESFWLEVRPVLLVRVPAQIASVQIAANPAVAKLGFPAGKMGKTGDSTWIEQDCLGGFSYGVVANWRSDGDAVLLALSIDRATVGQSGLQQARANCAAALAEGIEKARVAHEAWWTDYWAVSRIKIPDTRVQQLYDLAMYYYGAGSRKGNPPLPLQGVWAADNGDLPPWKGDYHHDMNTQVIYWAYYNAGHFAEGESLLDFMWDLAPYHRHFAKSFFGVEGLMVPGVMSFDGKPLGGWPQYTVMPTQCLWLFQNFHWHWSFTRDAKFLAERCYPYGANMAKAVEALLHDDGHGWLKFPLSTSPEIHDNRPAAWLKPNSNNDQATLLWFFAALAEEADALGKAAEAGHYRELLAKLEPLVTDPKDGVLLLTRGERLIESHRHHAHLMAVHPLALMTVEGSDTDRKTVLNSLEDLKRLGDRAWVGFSFPWAACLEARALRGDKALAYLRTFCDGFVARNGFNVNDRGGDCFTLDANFAHAQAVHEMLLQSWGDTIRIFPAMPSAWKDASFDRLRAEGGFVVSASRRGGQTTRVWIRSLAGQPCRIKPGFKGLLKLSVNDRVAAIKPIGEGVYELPLIRGDEALLISSEDRLRTLGD